MQEKIALVTGASSGIGQSLCRELVARRWSVFGVARTEEALYRIQKDLGHSFLPILCDVSDKASIERVSKALLEQQKCPSLFFLNAGG